mgnify:CR=1 FL=1
MKIRATKNLLHNHKFISAGAVFDCSDAVAKALIAEKSAEKVESVKSSAKSSAKSDEGTKEAADHAEGVLDPSAAFNMPEAGDE